MTHPTGLFVCATPRLAAIVIVLAIIGLACGGSGDTPHAASPAAEDTEPAIDFVDNLEKRVEAGEWTLEEGLVQTLKLFVGEAEPADVLAGEELAGAEGTGIVAMAADYVENGEDADTQAELSRLLDALFPTQQELDEVSAPHDGSTSNIGPELLLYAAQRDRGAPRDMSRRGLAVPFGCGDEPAPGLEGIGETGTCLEYGERQAAGARMRVYFPRQWFAQPQYSLYYDAALQAAVDSAEKFGTLGPIRPVNIVFYPWPPTALGATADAAMATHEPGGEQPCTIAVFPTAPTREDYFKQIVAHEMFHCYQYWNISPVSSNYHPRRWWIEGSAEYFSNVVYKQVDLEHVWLHRWSTHDTPLHVRAYENFIFFQHLANGIGDAPLVQWLTSLPASGDRDRQAQILSQTPAISSRFHDFARRLFTGDIRDTNGQNITGPNSGGYVFVNGPLTHKTDPIEAFTISTYTLTFIEPKRKYAITETAPAPLETGLFLWQSGTWESTPFEIDTCDGRQTILVVVTHTDPALQPQHSLHVEELDTGDDEDPCASPTPTPPPSGRPAPPPGPTSTTHGEPHLTTFDGLSYDFQAVGEFIHAKSTTDDFEIQVRFLSPPRLDVVSVDAAIAMNVAGDRVALYAGLEKPLRVNGRETQIEDDVLELPNGGRVYPPGGYYTSYLVVWPDNTQVDLDLGTWSGRGDSASAAPAASGFINSNIYLPAERAGNLIGLMGNANGEPADDIATRNGKALVADPGTYGLPVDFDDMYKVYGKSWRIKQEESLFDYGDGETTETFTDEEFPARYVSISDLTEAERAQAEATCRAAGIIDENLLRACILDVGLTGIEEFAELAGRLELLERVSDTPGRSDTGPIAFDADGNMHVIWFDETDRALYGDVFHRLRSPGGEWSDTTNLSRSGGKDFGVGSLALLRNPKGDVCAFWSAGRVGRDFPHGLYSRCYVDGQWTDAELMQSGGITGVFIPRYDPSGRLIIFEMYPASSLRIAGGGKVPNSGLVGHAAFIIDSQGGYHAAWDKAGAGIYHSYSNDRGQTWSPEELLYEGTDSPVLLAGKDGIVYLVHAGFGKTRMRQWTESSGWGATEVLPEFDGGKRPRIDSEGRLHVFVVSGYRTWLTFYPTTVIDLVKDESGKWQSRTVGALPTDAESVLITFDDTGRSHAVFNIGGQDIYYLPLR